MDEKEALKLARAEGWEVSHDGPDGGWIGLNPKIHQPDDAPVSLLDYFKNKNTKQHN